MFFISIAKPLKNDSYLSTNITIIDKQANCQTIEIEMIDRTPKRNKLSKVLCISLVSLTLNFIFLR